jgi:acetyl-CoA carboxylase biotin carboxyl carrier protein
MDIRKVKKLIELLEESGIAEIEITEGEEAVRISRFPQGTGALAPAAMQAAPLTMYAAPAAQAVAAAEAPAEAAVADGKTVTAPMVGTFYRSASPEADPYVKPGDTVSVGDTLCIIEAMKMMNPIESEMAGTVLSVEIENGEAVEFGQVLFKIG